LSPLVPPSINNIRIKSVNGYTPKPIQVIKNSVLQQVSNVNGNPTFKIDWCDNQTLTFATQRENFPNTTVAMDANLWEFPSGWVVNDSRANPVGGNRYWTLHEDIRVTPAQGDGGITVNQVKVQAYNWSCNVVYNSSSPYTYVSNTTVLYIDREPRLGSISASKISVNCGDTSPLTLSVPALTGAAYYTWSLPAGWVITSSPANANSVTVVPSGTGAGNVSVAATFTCSNPAKTVNTNPISIAYSNSLATPVFSSAPYDIGSYTPYSVTPVPGATSYTWEVSPNILINGQSSPQTNLSNEVTLSQNPGYSGAGWVRVTANSTQCSASQVYKETWVGIPEILSFGYQGSIYPACPNEHITFSPNYNGYQGQVLEYRWTATNISQHLGLTDPVLYVVVGPFIETGRRMEIGLEVRTSLGWSAKRTTEYEIRDCDGGMEPWFVANPVTEDEIAIETTYASTQQDSYSLFDQQGNLKRSGKLTGKKTKVSTKGMPGGLYYLQVEHNGLVSKKRLLLQK
jgi:hypothetical protein